VSSSAFLPDFDTTDGLCFPFRRKIQSQDAEKLETELLAQESRRETAE
jgi:hypothetical protein